MNDQLHVALDEADLLGVFPLLGGHSARLIGTIPVEDEKDREALRWEDFGPVIASRLGIEVQRVNWFSTYRVHHRVAGRFRDGRVFLAGDAAHVHSPVGAQGMNTGIGDAVDLSWKLADVVHGRAPESLLDTYEPERIAFARRLVRTTDQAFVFASGSGPLARAIRLHVVPRVLPRILRYAAVRRLMFRTVSQTAIHYRASRLSAGRAGRVRGGDRLPWAGENYDVLDGLTWQVHVYGTPAARLEEACRVAGVRLCPFPWRPEMARPGLVKDALYLVRPDGYLAWVDPAADAGRLRRYLGDLNQT
jgi:hypothetical protein